MDSSDRDRELLAFLSEHRFGTRRHVQALLGIGSEAAYRRLSRLAKSGLIRFERPLDTLPHCYRITRAGLAAIGSGLSPPRPVQLATYAHDGGVASLSIAAKAGVWGELSDVITERRMRSYDASDERLGAIGGPGEPYGTRLFGYGGAGRERLHYPDLVLVDRHGHRIAVELELTTKGRSRRERILEAYAADGRFDAVLYLVERPEVGRLIERSATRLGISKLVHVQRFRDEPTGAAPAAGRTATRTATHNATHTATRTATRTAGMRAADRSVAPPRGSER